MKKLEQTECLTMEEQIIEKIVLEYKLLIKNINLTDNEAYNDEISILLYNSICGNLNISNYIVSIYVVDTYHYSLLIDINGKAFILDPNYKKWFKNAKYKFENSKGCQAQPGFFVLKEPYGKKFATRVFKKGYFECTERNMKLYCDGFVLANYNNGKKLKDFIYDTKNTKDDYIANITSKTTFGEKCYKKVK